MNKKSKTIIIVVLVAIAAICLTAGVLSANNFNKPVQATVSDTPTITNTPSTTDNTDTTDNSAVNKVEAIMTPDEAMQLVNTALSPYYKATSAKLSSGSPNPVYIVHIIHTDPNHSDYGQDGGNVTVDTVTGFVDHKGI